MAKNKFDLSMVPAHFKKLIEVYGFEDEDLLSKAVAQRSATDWFAILFQDREDYFFAVDFRYTGQPDGKHEFTECYGGWEIQNDSIEGFKSIDEFMNCKLTQKFF